MLSGLLAFNDYRWSAYSVCSHMPKLLRYVDYKSARFCILCSSATRYVWPAWGSSVFFLGCGRVTLAFLDLWLKLLPSPYGIIFIIWVSNAEQAFYDSCLQNLFSLKNRLSQSCLAQIVILLFRNTKGFVKRASQRREHVSIVFFNSCKAVFFSVCNSANSSTPG